MYIQIAKKFVRNVSIIKKKINVMFFYLIHFLNILFIEQGINIGIYSIKRAMETWLFCICLDLIV